MKTIEDYLKEIQVQEQHDRMKELFDWIKTHYPQLEGVIKWNQPMFTDHGTFIIGFSTAKKHFSFNPEPQVIEMFKEDIHNAGYETTMALGKIKWTDQTDFDLLKKLIDFNLEDKKEMTSFFRKG
ncbi:MAG: DUF1801 domain-containing protein [Clostridia bacterium]|nr:DUF1801 domain-containing protein [Clostridia bacterium]